MITERDLAFCSNFMKNPLPKEKKWMTKYFKTKTKKLFLKYFVIFESTSRFCQHCGEVCTKRYVKKMKRQYLILTKIQSEAKRNLDFDALENIEKGKYALGTTNLKKSGWRKRKS